MSYSPRPATPERKDTVVFPDWVMLDRFGRTRCYNDRAAAAAAVKNDSTAVAVDMNSGQSGYFSFTTATPPKVSYLDLHWPYGPPESVFRLPAYPFVLTADKNHVLLGIDTHDHRSHDLFVYTAGTPSLLRRLPVCTEEAQGLTGRTTFLVNDWTIGILRRGGDHDSSDYVVADLVVSWERSSRSGYPHYDYNNPPPMIAVLCVLSSKTGNWKSIRMPAPQPQDQHHGQFPVLWSIDRVLPLDGRFLCWVDYYYGIVLCDLSDDENPVLRYVPFPGKQYTDETRFPRGCPEAFRSVCISQGMMRLVHIDNDWRETGSPRRTSGLTITIWTLKMMDDKCNWETYCVTNLDDLWAQWDYQVQGLPHYPPEFPVVTMDDPNVVCCLLRENELDENAWMIMIDMKSAALRSCTQYINEEICIEGMDVDLNGIFSNVLLLPTDFSKYLNKSPGMPLDGDKFAINPKKKKVSLQCCQGMTWNLVTGVENSRDTIR